MRLEALASQAPKSGAYPYATDGEEIDPQPMFKALARDLAGDRDATVIAARFHGFVAEAFSDAALAQAEAAGTDTIALSGGCFQNMTLLNLVVAELSELRVCSPGMVPSNDGGLAFGQALVALTRMETR